MAENFLVKKNYIFRLVNLTNDVVICFLPQITSSDITLAMTLHNLTLNDIGLYVEELVYESSAGNK